MSAPALPPSDPAPERTPAPEGDGTPWERRAPERASLVADLTAAMEREPLTPFDVDPQDVEALADRLVKRGWRRVTEDPDVQTAAPVLEQLGHDGAGPPVCEPCGPHCPACLAAALRSGRR